MKQLDSNMVTDSCISTRQQMEHNLHSVLSWSWLVTPSLVFIVRVVATLWNNSMATKLRSHRRQHQDRTQLTHQRLAAHHTKNSVAFTVPHHLSRALIHHTETSTFQQDHLTTISLQHLKPVPKSYNRILPPRITVLPISYPIQFIATQPRDHMVLFPVAIPMLF